MNYYVSVVDAGRVGLLAGPFTTHQEALDLVEPARAVAEKRDPWAHFYAFGTLSTLSYRPGILNEQLGVPVCRRPLKETPTP